MLYIIYQLQFRLFASSPPPKAFGVRAFRFHPAARRLKNIEGQERIAFTMPPDSRECFRGLALPGTAEVETVLSAVYIISTEQRPCSNYLHPMFTFIAWIILFILCWPLAILALVLYPFFWVLTLPFRILGIAVDGVLGLLKGIIMLPGRMLQR